MIICIGLNSIEITENAITFFIAGYDTTANTLAFACYCLATNQDVQEKLVEEIDTVLQGVCIYSHYILTIIRNASLENIVFLLKLKKKLMLD